MDLGNNNGFSNPYFDVTDSDDLGYNVAMANPELNVPIENLEFTISDDPIANTHIEYADHGNEDGALFAPMLNVPFHAANFVSPCIPHGNFPPLFAGHVHDSSYD
jgi:hypothetical protein